jgi:tRNA(fMet)-specific endonuclease VapC
MLICWPYERPAAIKFGQIFAELKSIGRPMQQIDMQVAAIAFILGDCLVVSGDSDLKAIPGLTVENWSTST